MPAPGIWTGTPGERDYPELVQADGHGFLISADAGRLRLVGKSGTGALDATWFFLMNCGGVRTLMPGEIGEVVPAQPRLPIPRQLSPLNPGPDFRLRIWSGTCGFDPTTWLGDEGATQRFEYHHNMLRIMPPERFTQTHPEYFAIRARKRYLPGSAEKNAWQPTYGEPGVVQRAIEYANETFTARPDLQSIPLTVNDGGGHSSSPGRRISTPWLPRSPTPAGSCRARATAGGSK